jgi:8-hydroxy-5-deazaflavin:NADPH oxidoreductase
VAPSSPAPVAVIGASGALGFGLALRLARVGVPIAIGSRDAARATDTAERAREIVPEGAFSGYDNAGAVEAAGDGGVVILSVPFRNQSETLANLGHTLTPGQLLIDATVPLAAAVAGKATRMLGVWQGSAAQQALEMAPEGVRVVSALHTVSAASLSNLEHPLAQDVLVCGDSRADKREAAGLIERIEGLRCVDCGKLEMARTTEALTALLISVNARYKVHAGIHLTSLPERLWE